MNAWNAVSSSTLSLKRIIESEPSCCSASLESFSISDATVVASLPLSSFPIPKSSRSRGDQSCNCLSSLAHFPKCSSLSKAGNRYVGHAPCQRLPEIQVKLGDVETYHWLVGTTAFARPERETSEVVVVLPVPMGHGVSKRTYRIIGKKNTALLGSAFGWQQFPQGSKTRVTQIDKTDVALQSRLCPRNHRRHVGESIHLVHKLLKRT